MIGWMFAVALLVLTVMLFRALREAAEDFRKMEDVSFYWERQAKLLAMRSGDDPVFVPPHASWYADNYRVKA